ncbi:MAG TPA: hypothetical protein PK715_09755, partial [Chitinophagales bacterium]|nr:hypothetical protein [Chitinophagales bacterium]
AACWRRPDHAPGACPAVAIDQAGNRSEAASRTVVVVHAVVARQFFGLALFGKMVDGIFCGAI